MDSSSDGLCVQPVNMTVNVNKMNNRVGKSKEVLKHLGFLVTEYNMQFKAQAFEKYFKNVVDIFDIRCYYNLAR